MPWNSDYNFRMMYISSLVRTLLAALLLFLPTIAGAAEIDRFIGSYIGSAEFVQNGAPQKRNLSVVIDESDNGFVLTWMSVTYRDDGRIKEREYTIEFTPSEREHIYQSAMKSNLFGKSVPLDPLAGEPFVWARFKGDTLSVFSLFIDQSGEYEVQEFHRTLVPEGLSLVFLRFRNGEVQREIRTVLGRE